MYPFHWFVQQKGYISKTRRFRAHLYLNRSINKEDQYMRSDYEQETISLACSWCLITTGCATKGKCKNKEDDNKKTEQSTIPL